MRNNFRITEKPPLRSVQCDGGSPIRQDAVVPKAAPAVRGSSAKYGGIYETAEEPKANQVSLEEGEKRRL